MQSLAGAALDLQRHAEALWSWCLCLPEQATRPELYLTHLKFILTALGELNFPSRLLIRSLLHSDCCTSSFTEAGLNAASCCAAHICNSSQH